MLVEDFVKDSDRWGLRFMLDMVSVDWIMRVLIVICFYYVEEYLIGKYDIVENEKSFVLISGIEY